jgi:hypothetical protein
MWKRTRRRSFAPNRPAVWPEQWPLLAVTLLAVLIGLAVVVLLVAG